MCIYKIYQTTHQSINNSADHDDDDEGEETF